jgi:serine/threonine-protein kinase RsbW
VVHTLTIPARYEALNELGPFVQAAASPAHSRVVTQMTLAVHELCANIIRHAYDGNEGMIYLEAARKPEWVEYLIRDHAPRGYTPPKHIALPDPLSLPEGGWGIFIVHEVMTTVEYRRLPDGNEWMLGKKLST